MISFLVLGWGGLFLEICYGRLFIIGGGVLSIFSLFFGGRFFPLQHFKFLLFMGFLGQLSRWMSALCVPFFLAANLVCLYTMFFF